MRKIRRWTPKEKRDEIVLRYLSGDNSVEELGEYYNVNPSTIRTWVKRFRQSKNVVSFLYKLENKLPRQANIGAVCSF